MKKIYALVLVLFVGCLSFAQVPYKQKNYGEILHTFDKLRSQLSVLYVAAHPDDENSRLISYLSLDKNYRTAYLALTRGDGGQNLLGGELGEKLGVIRTEELLDAREKDGAEQFFSRAVDFGYSKSPTETIQIWNEKEIIGDIVWVIRKFRPDVIITRFPTKGKSHGHHIASAILTAKAFDLAGDPKAYPEQLKYVQVWKPMTLFWNTYKFGHSDTTSDDQYHFEVGQFDRYLGKSYGEIAAESRSMHKSQGFGVSAYRDSRTEYLKYLKGFRPPSLEDPFKDLLVQKQQTDEEIDLDVAYTHLLLAKSDFQRNAIRYCIERLFKAREEFKKYNKGHRFDYRIKLVEDLIMSVSGVWIESIANQRRVSPGDTLDINSKVILRNPKLKMKLSKISYKGKDDTIIGQKLMPLQTVETKMKIYIKPSTHFTTPYWLTEKHGKGLYTVNDYNLLGQPKAFPKLFFDYTLTFEDYSLVFRSPVLYDWTDRRKGEQYSNVFVLPPVSISFDKEKYFVKGKKKSVKVELECLADSISGVLKFHAPLGFDVMPETVTVNIKGKGQKVSEYVDLVRQKDVTPLQTGELKAEVDCGEDKVYSYKVTKIAYEHIPTNYVLEAAKAEIPAFHLALTANARIGYIEGAGDDVEDALQQIGYDVDILSENDVEQSALSKYKAIILGIRAYNVNKWLKKANPRLLKYVQSGGTLIVQYNTSSYLDAVDYPIGPYPFTISRNRVSEEDAKVNILYPNDKLFNTPNELTESDWNNWVQERGIYFATDIDGHYKDFLKMHDAGEEPQGGSLIGAPYGSGYFFYTGLSLFRQLPAGVPGAFKLLVNMIEYK